MKTIFTLAATALVGLTACSTANTENEPSYPDTPSIEEENGFVYRIDASHTVGKISPYIYGNNLDYDFSHGDADLGTMVRFGGNRTTAFNWENNASNAGSDWHHSSDNHIPNSMVKGSDTNVPGSAASTFIKNCLAAGQRPLYTVPMIYSVAADKKGEVKEGDSSRWVDNIARKNAPFSLSPDLNDGAVYADELINFLTHTAGGTGKISYALDNEPDLWHSTHSRICKSHISCAELMERTVDFAGAIKDVDPDAEVFGFVSFGYSGFSTFSSAPDWSQAKSAGGYNWFIDYFVDKIARASAKQGRTLVDVLDLHWYPEAKGDNRVNQSSANTDKDKAARLQAPRSLWDETYKETSWITEQKNYMLPLIPKVKASIEKYCPDMKLAFTEFNYGGYEDITGTIALAEVLGVFGKYDIYAANHWSSPGTYGLAAYSLYRNYDGKRSTFGDFRLDCSMNKTWVNTGLFASASDESCKELHLVVSNKFAKDMIDAKFVLTSDNSYSNAVVYYISEGSPEIMKSEPVQVAGNRFTYTLPAMTVAHIVVK